MKKRQRTNIPVHLNPIFFKSFINIFPWVAAIALWFRLCLPSCGPGFESKAHQLRFFQFVSLKL